MGKKMGASLSAYRTTFEIKPSNEKRNTYRIVIKAPICSRSSLLMGSMLISLPLATPMFQFAKLEKSKECRLAT